LLAGERPRPRSYRWPEIGPARFGYVLVDQSSDFAIKDGATHTVAI
jgi:hypothetical protein